MDSIAICGSEKEYVIRLSECFRDIVKRDEEILLFTDQKAFGDYLKENRVGLCLALEDFVIGERNNIENQLHMFKKPFHTIP